MTTPIEVNDRSPPPAPLRLTTAPLWADVTPPGLQERGIRSGTIPASLAVGLGKACEIAQRDMVSDTAHIRAMADRLYHGITSQCDGVVLNGPQSTDHRYVGNMNLSFSYVEGESLIMGLKVCCFGHCFVSVAVKGFGHCYIGHYSQQGSATLMHQHACCIQI